MFTSHDGKKFGNAFVGKRRDREHGKEVSMPHGTSHVPATRKEDTEPMDKAMGKAKTSEHVEAPKPHEVVAEHGPAHTVTVTHEGGKHSVETEHKDSHVHEAEYDSPEEAHKAAKQLAGLDENEEGVSENEEAAEAGGEPFDFGEQV